MPKARYEHVSVQHAACRFRPVSLGARKRAVRLLTSCTDTQQGRESQQRYPGLSKFPQKRTDAVAGGLHEDSPMHQLLPGLHVCTDCCWYSRSWPKICKWHRTARTGFQHGQAGVPQSSSSLARSHATVVQKNSLWWLLRRVPWVCIALQLAHAC